MGRYKCSADNCDSSSESDIKFFKFPLYNPRKLRRWLQSMKREDWTPSRFSVLCIRHFEEQHLDRTGKSVTLKEEAVPTVFTSAAEGNSEQDREPIQIRDVVSLSRSTTNVFQKVSNDNSMTSSKPKKPRGRPPKNRTLESKLRSLQSSTSEHGERAPPAAPTELRLLTDPEPADDQETEVSESWSVIVDENLMRIHSFPHFFHGSYCFSQDIQWAPDSSTSKKSSNSTNIIEVSGPWQWLGLDLRGPLPLSSSGHRFLLTLLDYSSRWIEAWPVEFHCPKLITDNLMDAIRNFGFPLRILSRLPLDTVTQINEQLKAELTVEFPLVVQHHRTGSIDLATQQNIDRMVQQLVEQHPSDWDVFLQAQVFSLCLRENPSTKQRPFSLLCCGSTNAEHTPRGLQLQELELEDCEFVVK